MTQLNEAEFRPYGYTGPHVAHMERKAMTRVNNEREQKLVTIAFQLVSTAFDPTNVAIISAMSHKERMEWVADNLRGCGFPTVPVGSNWGVLVEE